MAKVKFEEVHSGVGERIEDKVLQAYHKVLELMQKENDRIIWQNEIEIMRKKGKSCFDTAKKGSKIYRRELKK